jgi:hypothetical protein
MEIDLKLTQEEVNFVLSVLGELPTKTGSWVIVQKIKTQAESQTIKPITEEK